MKKETCKHHDNYITVHRLRYPDGRELWVLKCSNCDKTKISLTSPNQQTISPRMWFSKKEIDMLIESAKHISSVMADNDNGSKIITWALETDNG